MVGGTTSGYSLMGRRHIAMNPTMKITAESTPAKIGLRMKNAEKFIPLILICWSQRLALRCLQIVCRLLRGYRRFRRHRHPGPDTLQPIDYNLLARLEPSTDDTLALQDRTQFHRPILDRVGRRERQDELLALVCSDCPLLDQQCRMPFAQW